MKLGGERLYLNFKPCVQGRIHLCLSRKGICFTSLVVVLFLATCGRITSIQKCTSISDAGMTGLLNDSDWCSKQALAYPENFSSIKSRLPLSFSLKVLM